MILYIFYGIFIGAYLTFGVFVAHDFKESTYHTERIPEGVALVGVVVGWMFIAVYVRLKEWLYE